MHNVKPPLAISLAIILSLSLITTMFSFSLKKILAQNSSSNIKFLTYSNLTSGAKILYPSYWQKSEHNNIISFATPLKTVGVKFAIMPSANMSLDEFTIKRIAKLRETLINFDIGRASQEEFLFSPAQTLLFTYGNGENISKVLQAWTIKDNKVYMITYFADAVLFDTFLPTALKVINSLQLIGNHR